MEYKYFIGKNRNFGSQDLRTDKHIFKTADDYPPIGVGGDFEGPFKSVKELTEKSTFYSNLKNQNPRTAIRLIYPQNIREVENFLLIPKDKSFDKELFKTIQHALKPDFIKGRVQGLHFFNPKDTKILEIYRTNSKGVVFAKILKQDFRTKKWFQKETTLFPLHWHMGNLFAELDIAFLYRFLILDFKNKYGAVTPSGVKVIFVLVDGKGKTVYPII
ncbi:EndoU domain-containing protein [Winogradskyella sp.]|uniref:EndoU domain-containing protein n=1 Tax=Winogradskyella sp. TaxID=1883156 RepID=UPI003AB59C58